LIQRLPGLNSLSSLIFICPEHTINEAKQRANDQGRSDGGYIGIYTPQKISNRFVHVWDTNTCFKIAMTS